MDALFDRELEQLREALHATAPAPGSHEWAQGESPDPEARVRAAAAWAERACAELPEGHPMRLRRS